MTTNSEDLTHDTARLKSITTPDLSEVYRRVSELHELQRTYIDRLESMQDERLPDFMIPGGYAHTKREMILQYIERQEVQLALIEGELNDRFREAGIPFDVSVRRLDDVQSP